MERSKKNWLFPKFHKDASKHGIPCHHRSYRDGGIIRNKREVLEAPEPAEREVALEDQAQNLKSPNTQQSQSARSPVIVSQTQPGSRLRTFMKVVFAHTMHR